MPYPATGIEKNNSLDYLEHTFSALNSGQTVINLSDVNEDISLSEYELCARVETTTSKGWYQGTPYQKSDSEDVAQILFSSGTEGTPKAICVSHAALANTTNRLTQVMSIDSSIREYIGVPVTFSFGFGRCRVVSAAGGEFYLPPNGFDPLEISSMLRNDEINAISAVPTLWRLILEEPSVISDVSHKVKWIEIGSQYMAGEEKAQMAKLFPNAVIVQHYGLTEASRSTFLKIHTANKSELESVGEALFGVEVKTAEDGRILIRGPHLATRIYQEGTSVEIKSDDWFETNDKGRIENGKLVFEGRMDDIINCGGIKLSPEKLDRQLYSSLQLEKGLHCVKVNNAQLGETVGIAILDSCAIDPSTLKAAANEILGNYGITIGNNLSITTVQKFPYTDTGKLKRKELSAKLSREINSNQATQKSELEASDNELSGEALILDIFNKVLGGREVSPEASLRSLGADSLSIVQLRMTLSKHLSTVPHNWIDLSVKELSKHLHNSQKPSKLSAVLGIGNLESYIPMRAAAIVLVVLHHYNIFYFDGGATSLLFVISGLLFFSANQTTIESGKHIGRLWLGLAVLICTLIPVTGFQAVMHSYFGSDWHISLILPIENLVYFYNDITNTVDTKHHVHWLWFIHAYLQMFGFLALCFSFRRVRAALANNLFNSLLIAFFISEALAFGIIYADAHRQDIFHSAALLQYYPTTLLPLVLFGGLIALSKTHLQRTLTIIAAVSYIAINYAGVFTQGGLYTLGGVILLLWLPTIPIPKVLHRPFMLLAESSLFIYLTHMPIKFALLKVSPFEISLVSAAVIAIAIAIIAWPIWSSLVVGRIRKVKALH